jgi:cold shock protein
MIQQTESPTESNIESLRVGAPAGCLADPGSGRALAGVIKWFDMSKGYGFVVPDNGMPDILLDVSCLRRGGFQVVHPGARVVVEAQRRARGLQACRILSMDAPAVLPAAQQFSARIRVCVVPTSGLEQAKVKWFNRIRGFGFLTRGADTPDIFVHAETVRRSGLTELRPGQAVLVRYGTGPKGLTAAEVRPPAVAQGPALH